MAHPTDLTPAEFDSILREKVNREPTLPSEIPVKNEIGKLALMQPRENALNHPAAPLLQEYATNGCPVNCGDNWSKEQILLLLKRGPHQSANMKSAIQQLRTETKDKVHHGYARVIKWKDIKEDIPPQLKISPVAMIPHKSKKFRCILDLSFNLFHKGKRLTSVNESTKKMAKPEAMVQLGLSLKRIIAVMADTWAENNPFYFTKLDIKDGFWRMAVNDDAAWNFCYVLPSLNKVPIDEIEIVVPNSLQMGWCESPPFFCSGTETARDIIQYKLESTTVLPPHKFEDIMLSKLSTSPAGKSSTPLHCNFNLEVFVDDFIGMAQTSCPQQLRHFSRALLHGIHEVFPPPSVTKHNGFDPISEGKLEKGEGTWDTTKEVLGWDIDGKAGTIQLPGKKCSKLRALLKTIMRKHRVSLNKFQQLAGKLQHASYGLPGGKGLFSAIQMAMVGNPDFITMTTDLKQILSDWQYIISFMEKHPTSIHQLVVDYPAYVGYSDACGLGAGGIWCSGLSPLQPFLWQVEWPQDIKKNLVTAENPNGSVTINDLELAGAVLNWLALELQPNLTLKHQHVGTYCDNTSAVAWAYKLRTSKSKIASRLLRLLSLRIHQSQATGLTPLNIAGENNDMADIVSRAFKNGKYFDASDNLISYFNSHFPLPQQKSWMECILPQRLVSRVIACLRGEQLPMASLLRLPGLGKNTGVHGQRLLQNVTLTPSCKTQVTSKEISVSMPLLHGSGQARTVEELKSEFKESRMRFHPSARPSNWLENIAPSTEKMESHTT